MSIQPIRRSRDSGVICVTTLPTKRTHIEQHSNRVHLEKKNFKCDHCDKAFGRKETLTMHINCTYKKIKRFWCDLCDLCDFSSYTRGDLEKHSNIVHLEKKTFKCDHCDKAFSQKPNLDVHVNRIHKKIKSYSCELCSYISCTNYELKRPSVGMHSPKKAHRPDLYALIQEAQKDNMIVLVEKKLPETYSDHNYFEEILDTI
jgi:hypothetical protein